MPKKVDHEDRRQAIAAAVWRLASTQGLEAVSLNEVAAEAGVSKGMVQHYFTSRDELVVYAASRACERRTARVLRNLAPGATPRVVLRTGLVTFLPTDDESRSEALVENAFLIRAVTDARLAADLRRSHTATIDVLARIFRDAQRAGELSPDADPEVETARLLALTAGLTTHLLLGHQAVPTALASIDHQLDQLRQPVKETR